MAGTQKNPRALLALGALGVVFGDIGTITPAISVLSALEGLEEIGPGFKNAVVPGTTALLVALITSNRHPQYAVARAFEMMRA